MSNTEKKLEFLDFVVLFGLVIVSCLAGNILMSRVSNTILGFNVPAIGVLVIGELVWLKARRMIQDYWNNQEGQEK